MEEPRPVNYQRLLSEESTVSEPSLEDYQTDIYEQLPSSQKRLQHKDQVQEAEVHWNPNQPLKMLPLCIQEKRNIRDRQHLERCIIGYWASWKRSQEIARRRLREQVGRVVSGLLLWKTTLHNIEGRFGVGVKAYFVCLRYLLFLNFLNLAIIVGTVLSPTLYSTNTSTYTHWYHIFTENGSFVDIFLGTGFMEHSPVFYGFYTNHSLGSKCLNTALLFFFGMLTVLLLNLIMIVCRMVVGYKNTWLTGIHFNANMSYKVFCGWDFCIREPGAAFLKHNLIRNELKMDLEEQKFRQKVSGRSLKQWILLYTLRIVLNFVVLVLLSGSIYLIYIATKDSSEAMYEDYSLTTQLNVTLVRSILLKLGSLAVYLFFLLTKESKVMCRETEFGKDMYKLTIFHFLASFCNTFLVAYPRKVLVEKCLSSNLSRRVGKQQFVIPMNVLDLVYSQTVTWVGVFYCPFLPAINILKLLAIFYISKFNLVQCCDPPRKMFRTTSSSVLFHFMLLLGLVMVDPGECGPFHTNQTVYNVTRNCVSTLPEAAQEGIRYMTSEAFAFTIILMEIIILTSYVSRGRTNQKAIERLKDMLVMCGSDKRYLVKHHATLLRRRQRRTVNHSEKVTSKQ
ncbi:hypothetical protein PDJAM_G00024440 [Pangasius djambal]|uniref:Uncharacterized protein n=1 Tax=Pangasius djambal TaxID=1691987 RepID=A0ACC5YPK3_9TELE|nr:hypothetical protein [Pangasius djambal]